MKKKQSPNRFVTYQYVPTNESDSFVPSSSLRGWNETNHEEQRSKPTSTQRPNSDTFNTNDLDAIRRYLPSKAYILDPFVFGEGTIHQLRRNHGLATIGVSIEPEHSTNPYTIHANPANDLLDLFGPNRFSAIVTMPPLGSSPDSYRRLLGRHPSAESPASFKFFSDAYRERMWRSWIQAEAVLKPGGVFIVGLRSFSVEGITTAHSSAWHIPLLVDLGLVEVGVVKVPGDTGRGRRLHLLRKPSRAGDVSAGAGAVGCCHQSCEVAP